MILKKDEGGPWSKEMK
jgi:hypothetical protein